MVLVILNNLASFDRFQHLGEGNKLCLHSLTGVIGNAYSPRDSLCLYPYKCRIQIHVVDFSLTTCSPPGPCSILAQVVNNYRQTQTFLGNMYQYLPDIDKLFLGLIPYK